MDTAGFEAVRTDKDGDKYQSPVFRGDVVMDAGIESRKVEEFDDRSIGETIDDIVNELRTSGVVGDVDVPKRTESLHHADVSGHNGHNDTNQQQNDLEHPSNVSAVSLSGSKDETAEGTEISTADQIPAGSDKKLETKEPGLSTPSVEEGSLQETSPPTSEREENDASQAKEEMEVDNSPKEGEEQSNGGEAEDAGQPCQMPRKNAKSNAKSRGTLKQEMKRRLRGTLKYSPKEAPPKQAAGLKSSKRTSATGRLSLQHTKRTTNTDKEGTSDDESFVQLVKHVTTTIDTGELPLYEDKPGDKINETKRRGLQRGMQKALENDMPDKESKETGDVEDEPLIEIAKRRKTSRMERVAGNGDVVEHIPETSKMMQGKKAPKRGTKGTGKRQLDMGYPSMHVSEPSSMESMPNVCNWSSEDFAASDAYLREVIDRSLLGGSAGGRFLTIELPEVDRVMKRRAWRTPCTRRSRPVVFGGCDPNQVYIEVMGVRVPVSCWARVEQITPRVRVTDIFEDVVRRQSACPSE